MMTREQIERIAAGCGVEVSFAEVGKGGFIVDSSGAVYESVNDVFMGSFESQNRNRRRYAIDDESAFLAA